MRFVHFNVEYSYNQAEAARAISSSGNYTFVNGLLELHRQNFRNKIELTIIDASDDADIYALPAEIRNCSK